MSLADHLRYLRAMRGGVTTKEIADEIGLAAHQSIGKIERKYKAVADEALIEKLAAYYGRSAEEFQWHNARPRKYLTFFLAQALRTQERVSLTLRSEEVLTGQVAWWDLASIGLRTEDGRLLVVQRHAVVDWPQATIWQDYVAPEEEDTQAEKQPSSPE